MIIEHMSGTPAVRWVAPQPPGRRETQQAAAAAAAAAMEVARDDPLRATKLRLLSELGAGQGRASDLARLPVDACLAAARALVLRSDEWAAWAPRAASLSDAASGTIGARNEAAALALLHAHADAVCGGDAARCARLEELSAGYLERCGGAAAAHATTGAAAGEPAAQPDPASAALQAWAEARGMATRLAPAVLLGGLRGLVNAGPGALAAGEEVIALPAALLITYQTAKESDLGRALSRIPGLADDALVVIWTMVERHDPEAEAAPFWAALPQRFCTGLGAPAQLVALLAGTPAHAQFASARAHLWADFAALAPVFETLLRAFGQHLKPEWFQWDAFVWAAELWYAYAIQVRLPGGATAPALAPFVSLLNHSPWPHVVRFSEVDAASNALRLRLLRPAAEGEEVCLSYGPLPNADLLLFYGFALERNPADRFQVSLNGDDAAGGSGGGGQGGGGGGEGAAGAALRRQRLAALERLGLSVDVDLWPEWRRRQTQQLLPAARVMTASAAQLSAAAPAAATPGRGGARGGKGGRKGKAPQRQQQAAAPQRENGGWPMERGDQEGEAAALAALEAAAVRALAPYQAALERVREELRSAAEGAPAAEDGAATAASAMAVSAASVAAREGGDGEEGEGVPFTAAERLAFLRHQLARQVAVLGSGRRQQRHRGRLSIGRHPP